MQKLDTKPNVVATPIATKAKAKTTTTTTTTLYERIGQKNLQSILDNFFNELAKCEEVMQFYKSVSIVSLKAHLESTLKMLFGRNVPAMNDLLDSMLVAHTRVFRDMGVNETHFDLLAQSLVAGIQCVTDDETLLNDVVAIVVPLRIVFEYGSRVAKQEREVTECGYDDGVPTLTGEMMLEWQAQKNNNNKNDQLSNVVLPNRGVDAPTTSEWLGHSLLFKNGDKHCVPRVRSSIVVDQEIETAKGIIRAWTCCLADLFVSDPLVADHFMAIDSYQAQHKYLVRFLMLAFSDHIPWQGKAKRIGATALLKSVLYPCGKKAKNQEDCASSSPTLAALSLPVYDRMIYLFEEVCIDIHDGQYPGIPHAPMQWADAVQKLKSLRSTFVVDVEPPMIESAQPTSSPRRKSTAAMSAMERQRQKLKSSLLPHPPVVVATDYTTRDTKHNSDDELQVCSCHTTKSRDEFAISERSYNSVPMNDSTVVVRKRNILKNITKKTKMKKSVDCRSFKKIFHWGGKETKQIGRTKLSPNKGNN